MTVWKCIGKMYLNGVWTFFIQLTAWNRGPSHSGYSHESSAVSHWQMWSLGFSPILFFHLFKLDGSICEWHLRCWASFSSSFFPLLTFFRLLYYIFTMSRWARFTSGVDGVAWYVPSCISKSLNWNHRDSASTHGAPHYRLGARLSLVFAARFPTYTGIVSELSLGAGPVPEKCSSRLAAQLGQTSKRNQRRVRLVPKAGVWSFHVNATHLGNHSNLFSAFKLP